MKLLFVNVLQAPSKLISTQPERWQHAHPSKLGSFVHPPPLPSIPSGSTPPRVKPLILPHVQLEMLPLARGGRPMENWCIVSWQIKSGFLKLNDKVNSKHCQGNVALQATYSCSGFVDSLGSELRTKVLVSPEASEYWKRQVCNIGTVPSPILTMNRRFTF